MGSRSPVNHFRHLLLTAIISLVAIGGILAWKAPGHVPISQPFAFMPAPLTPLPTAPAAQTKQSPWRLSIPSIGLNVAIQAVGLAADGSMGVPSSYADAGWFDRGPLPGEPGNAVIAGHLNGGFHQSAVFENLHKLKRGDSIVTSNKDTGSQQYFKVISSQNYDVSQAPLDKIFGPTHDTHLNLITCSGDWDKKKKNYSQRLVVFTALLPV